MKLFNIGYFNNFCSLLYDPIPKKFILDKEILLQSQDVITHWNNDSKLVIFGSYDLEDSNLTVIYVDFPAINYQNNVHYLLLDTWATVIDEIYNTYSIDKYKFILTSEFLSSLEDPRPLLIALKKIGLHFGVECLIVYSDTYFYRKWTFNQLKYFFQASGFNCSVIQNELLLEVTLTQSSYKEYFNLLNLNPNSFSSKFCLLTTEDATVTPTGGIGTYVKCIKKINKNMITLICDHNIDSSNSKGNTVVASSFIEHIEVDNFMNGIGLIEVIKSLLFLFPNINILEFQDYQSIGFRIVQAKKTGVLPSYLWLRVFLHGNVNHLKYSFQNNDSKIYNEEEIIFLPKDNYIFQYVDQVYCPSMYLSQRIMQEEYGYQLNNLSIQKLPFDLDIIGEVNDINISNIENIVFIGKFNKLKGWDDFIEAITLLNHSESLHQIKNILSFCPGEPSISDEIILSQKYSYKSLHLSHDELIAWIKENKNKTLFIVPAGGENYSYVVLELLLLGTFFIGYNKGGAVEVLDDKNYNQMFFSEPDSNHLSKTISRLLSDDYKKYSEPIIVYKRKFY